MTDSRGRYLVGVDVGGTGTTSSVLPPITSRGKPQIADPSRVAPTAGLLPTDK